MKIANASPKVQTYTRLSCDVTSKTFAKVRTTRKVTPIETNTAMIAETLLKAISTADAFPKPPTVASHVKETPVSVAIELAILKASDPFTAKSF